MMTRLGPISMLRLALDVPAPPSKTVQRLLASRPVLLMPPTPRGFHTAARTRAQSAAPQDPYRVLGVKRSASQKEIKQAYFAASKQYHPDRHERSTEADQRVAHAAFVAVNSAYEVLGSPLRRREFDLGVTAALHPEYPDTASTVRPPGPLSEAERDFYQGDAYRGTSPYKVASNSTIIFGIILFAVTGLCVHLWLYERHRHKYMQMAQERNIEAAESLHEAKQRAKDGYKVQLQRLNERATYGEILSSPGVGASKDQ